MRYKRYLSYILFVGLVFTVLQSCLLSSGSRGGGVGNHVYRGFYSITFPTAGSYLNLDSTYQVLWTKRDTVTAPFVNIYLYHVDTLKAVVVYSAQNNGTFSWSVRNSKVGSGTGYRLKIVSTTDTAQWDVSYDFVLQSNYSGLISVTGPAAGTLAQVDSALAIRWTSQGSIGSYVSIQLLKDTTLAGMVSTLTSNTGAYNWNRVSTTLGTASNYRIKITSNSDPAIQGISAAFSINSGYSGSIAITSPKSGDSLTGGTMSNIAWTVSGNPGVTANIQLYRDTVLVGLLGTGTNLSAGYLGWMPSTGMVTSDKYRIKIISAQDPGLAFYSGFFSIGGLAADAYENDDSLRFAKPIPSDGTVQSHTITSQNADWMQFTAAAGQGYLATVKAPSSISLSLFLYDSLGVLLTSKAGSLAQIITTPANSGKYFLRVTSQFGFGSYTVSLSRFDSSQTGGFLSKFSSPDSSTIWAAGSNYLITWLPDSLSFGSYVTLQLYRDTTLVQTIASSTVNGGSYSWSTTAGMMSSNKYRIRMTNASTSQIYGYSANFSISGVNADTYEPDNTRGLAKDIPTNGSVQARTLTATDLDWIKFSVQAGQSYWIKVATPTTTSLAVYADSMATSTLGSSSTSNPSVLVAATTTGTYYIQVSGYNYGNYSLSVRLFQPDSIVKFSNPTEASTFSAGSTYSLSWQPDSSLGAGYVTLYLYRGNSQLANIAYTNFTAGSVSWIVPPGLASGSDYQIRIPFNSGLTANSPRFSISGILSDSLETNDSSAAARVLVPNVGRHFLSLTYGDKDWFQFAAKAKMVYILQTIASISLYHNITLYNGLGTSLIKQGSRVTGDSGNTLAWICPADGTYSFSIISTSATYSGVYALEFKAYAPADYQFLVSAPLAAATLKYDQSVSIQWSNNAEIKGAVDLFLFNSAGVVKTIAAGVANSGTYSWTVDATLTAGTDYYVKVSSLIGSDIAGKSGVFSVGP